jgi:hypothetical protein
LRINSALRTACCAAVASRILFVSADSVFFELFAFMIAQVKGYA